MMAICWIEGCELESNILRIVETFPNAIGWRASPAMPPIPVLFTDPSAGWLDGSRTRHDPRVFVAVIKEMGQPPGSKVEFSNEDIRVANWSWYVYGGVLIPTWRPRL